MRGLLYDQNYRPHFSGHETFPLRQLWLKKAYDAVTTDKKNGGKGVFSAADAIVTFGVGKNMVGSIRHWGLACEILKEEAGGYAPTELGELLLAEHGLDPFCEKTATSWLAHWKLAGKAERSTTWCWIFNYVSEQSFTAEKLRSGLMEYAQSKNARISDLTIKRDIEVFLRSYVPKVDSSDVEDIAAPMLAELGLIQTGGKGIFEFRRGPKSTLPDEIFLFALIEYWNRVAPSVSTMSFESLAYEPGSPGRVFKLDEDSVAERLIGLNDLTGGKYVWSDTAGLRQVVCTKGPMNPLDVLRGAYG